MRSPVLRLWYCLVLTCTLLVSTVIGQPGPAPTPTAKAPAATTPAATAPAAGNNTAPALSLVHTLKDHTELVYCVAYSPDGKLLATASFDKSVKLWDAATGKLLKSFAGPTGHQNLVLHVAFSPDGKLLASCGSDNTIKLWAVPTGDAVRSFPGHTEPISVLAVSPDGSRLATAGADKSIRLWNLADGKLLHTCTGHSAAVKCLAFSPDGKTLLSGSGDQSVRLWNVADGQPIVALGGHTGPVTAVAFAADGQQAYTAGTDGQVKTWQLPIASSRILNPPHAGPITALALTGDGSRLITASGDNTVRVSQAGTAAQERILNGPSVPFTALATAGNLVAGLAADQQVLLWDATDGKAAGTLPPGKPAVKSLALHPQGKELILGLEDGHLRIVPLPLGQSRQATAPEAITLALPTAAGDRLFTASSEKNLRGWNLSNLQADQQYAGLTAPVTALALRGDELLAGTAEGELLSWKIGQPPPTSAIGSHLAPIAACLPLATANEIVTASHDGSVKKWKAATPVRKVDSPAPISSWLLSPNGKQALVGSADGTTRIADLATGKVQQTLGEAGPAVTAVAWSTDGAKVAVARGDASIRIFTSADGKEVHKLEKLPAAPSCLAFTPKADALAWAGTDGKARLTTLADGKATKEWAAHPGNVLACGLTPDGNRLFTHGADNTVQIWNLADGKNVAKVAPAGLAGMAVAADGRTLATVGNDKLVRFWNPADGKPAGQFAIPPDAKSVAFNANGQKLAVGLADGRVLIYDRDGNLLEYQRQAGPVARVQFTGDDWAASGEKTLTLHTPRLAWATRFAGGLKAMVWHPAAQQFIAAGDDKTIKFLRPSDGVAVRIYAGPQAPLVALALSPDGQRLAAAGADQKIWLWNTTTHRPERQITATAAVSRIDFSADGANLLVATGPTLRAVRVADGEEQPIVQTLPVPLSTFLTLTDAKTKRPLTLLAGNDKSLKLLDTAAPRQVPVTGGAVTALAVSPSGSQWLTAGVDKSVKLWDAATGKETRAFTGLPGAATAVAFSREASPTRVAAASGPALHVWTLADGKSLFTLGAPGEIKSFAFSPDGSRLALATASGRVALFDAKSGQELQFFQQPGAVEAVAFAADGRSILFGGADKTVTFAPAAVARVFSQQPAVAVQELLSIPGTPLLALAQPDGAIQLVNPAAGKIERTLKGHAGAVTGLAVHKSGATLFSAGADKTLRAWNVADGKELKKITLPAAAQGLALAPSGAAVLVATGEPQAMLLNVAHTPGQPLPGDFGKQMGAYAHGAPVQAVAFQPDSSGFLTAGADKLAKAWRLPQDAPLRNLAGHSNIVDALAFSADGSQLATTGHDGTVRLWNVADGAQTLSVPTFGAPIYCLAWSKDGKELLAGSFARAAKVVDVEKKAPGREFADLADKAFAQGPYAGPFAKLFRAAWPTGHRDAVYAVAYSPDQQSIVTASGDGQILVWNRDGTVARSFIDPALSTGGPLAETRAHRDWINHFRFTPDGTRLVSVGNAGFLKVWNFADGRLLYQQKLPIGLYSVAFAPDGKTMATANHDGTAFILKVP